MHDFLIKELGRAVPYGIYDLAANAGWVSVGMNHDTAAFAVQTIRRWWHDVGPGRYPHATQLTITATEAAATARGCVCGSGTATLANELGIAIAVHHLPPGTSKWNKIEHRLFSFITMNWRAKPLVSYRVIVDLISATTTDTGLTVRCELEPHPIRRASPCPIGRWPRSISSAMPSTASGTTRSGQPHDQTARLFRITLSPARERRHHRDRGIRSRYGDRAARDR